jgi:hypothetical protein
MPSQKSMPSKDSTRVNESSGLQKLTLPAWVSGAAPAVLPVACVLATAVLIAVYHTSQPADRASVERHPQQVVAQAVAVKAEKAVVPIEPARANAPVESAPKAIVPMPTPMPMPAPATVTGCLERADETFRLKDTTGVDVPKARSWKSGFLKKGSASIEIVDAPSMLNLPDHVGQRVTVTGTLVDREMRVLSLHRVAASCTSSPSQNPTSSKAVS